MPSSFPSRQWLVGVWQEMVDPGRSALLQGLAIKRCISGVMKQENKIEIHTPVCSLAVF